MRVGSSPASSTLLHTTLVPLDRVFARDRAFILLSDPARQRERDSPRRACREKRDKGEAQGRKHARSKEEKWREGTQTATLAFQLWRQNSSRKKKNSTLSPLDLLLTLLSLSPKKRLLALNNTRNHDLPTPTSASCPLRLPGPPPPQAELLRRQRLRRPLRGHRRRRRRRRQRQREQWKGLGGFFFPPPSRSQQPFSLTSRALSDFSRSLCSKNSSTEAARRRRPRRWLRTQPGD